MLIGQQEKPGESFRVSASQKRVTSPSSQERSVLCKEKNAEENGDALYLHMQYNESNLNVFIMQRMCSNCT